MRSFNSPAKARKIAGSIASAARFAVCDFFESLLFKVVDAAQTRPCESGSCQRNAIYLTHSLMSDARQLDDPLVQRRLLCRSLVLAPRVLASVRQSRYISFIKFDRLGLRDGDHSVMWRG